MKAVEGGTLATIGNLMKKDAGAAGGRPSSPRTHLLDAEVHHGGRLALRLSVEHDIDALAAREGDHVVGVAEVKADDGHDDRMCFRWWTVASFFFLANRLDRAAVHTLASVRTCGCA